jgi:hypothetical protein
MGWGKEGVLARWIIYLEPPYAVTPWVLNREADRAAQIFVTTFGQLGYVRQAEGGIVEIDQAGTLVREHGHVELVGLGSWRFRPVSSGRLLESEERAFISHLVLRLSDALHFCYDSGLEWDAASKACFQDPFVGVTVNSERWIVGSDHGARHNRPRLEQALRGWEAATARPIADWESPVAPHQISRYGFQGTATS